MNTKYNPLKLPVNAKGEPIPWVAQARGRTFTRCLNLRRCWVCGDPLGVYHCYVTQVDGAFHFTALHGPMHRKCADFVQEVQPAGEGITALWTVSKQKKPKRFHDGLTNLFMVHFGQPSQLPLWRGADGRPPTRTELWLALDTVRQEKIAEAADDAERAALHEAFDHAATYFLPTAGERSAEGGEQSTDHG